MAAGVDKEHVSRMRSYCYNIHGWVIRVWRNIFEFWKVFTIFFQEFCKYWVIYPNYLSGVSWIRIEI